MRSRRVLQYYPREFERLVGDRDQQDLDAINDLTQQLQEYPDKQTLKASTDRLRTAFAKLTAVLQSLGMDQRGGLQANLDSLQSGANQFAGGSRQIADAVAPLVDQVKQMGAGLDEAFAFLLSLKRDAAKPAMAGFNIPAQLLHLEEFQKAAQVFISQDGHSVRYLVQTNSIRSAPTRWIRSTRSPRPLGAPSRIPPWWTQRYRWADTPSA